MGKKVEKILTMGITSVMGLGAISVPAMASEKNNNIADLYKAAYESSIATEKKGTTQAEINVARKAISALKGTSLAYAVPTFSSIVDKAQQKFLTVAYDSIVKCQKTEKQGDVNIARNNIKDLPPEFKNAYSMAIDKVQQAIIKDTVEAVKKAEETQADKDITVAQNLLDELQTVKNNEAVENFAKTLEEEFKTATSYFKVKEVEVLNNNSIKIDFNKEIDTKTLSESNFIANKKGETYNKLRISSAVSSKDGMSVTVTFVKSFEDKVDYDLVINNLKAKDGKELSKKDSLDFEYKEAKIASISFTTDKIPAGSYLRNYVVIKDDLGRDVTDEYKDKLNITSTNLAIVKDGKVVISARDLNNTNDTVIVSVDIEGSDVNISNKLITITKTEASMFEGFAIVNKDLDLDDKAFSQIDDKTDYVTVGEKNARLVLGFKDQFGKEIDLDDTQGFTVEHNYAPDVINVDSNGDITGLSKGTAHILIKYGDIERTIVIEVKDAAVPTKIETEKNDYTFANSNQNGIEIGYTVMDEYNQKYTGNSDVMDGDVTAPTNNGDVVQQVRYTITNSKKEDVTSNFKTSEGNGKISVAPKTGEKLETGVYTLNIAKEYIYFGEKTTINKSVTINVIKAGSLASYNVVVGNNKLDLSKQNNEDKLPQSTNITLYELDGSGNIIDSINKSTNSNFKLQIFDENNKDVTPTKTDSNNPFNFEELAKGELKAQKTGTYNVKVMLGDFLVKQVTITVVDTASKVTTANLKQTATINAGDSIQDILKDAKCDIKDQYGKTMDKAELADVECLATNLTNIEQFNGNLGLTTLVNTADKKSEGSFDLVVRSVTVKGDKKIIFTTPVDIFVTVKNK